ncbi:MAG: hypothetical protein SF187_13775 [Deltaproteobacteria bacterium]|nr:hypothetical protein [Deltaproteobacteria bacterium]
MNAALSFPQHPRLGRWLASASLVTCVATFVAVEADFVRRHRPGVNPDAYLRPQAMQILAPGLGGAAGLAAAAAWVKRRQRFVRPNDDV